MIFTQTLTPVLGAKKETPLSWLRKTNDFESTVRREMPVLFRVARRMGCTAEEAEDVVQSAVIKAYRAWDKFDGRHVRSWLIRIVRNERLMALRSRESDHASLDESDSYEVPDEPFWDNLEAKLNAEKIMEELQALPEIYRLAVHLCDVEDMSYEEAAAAMDVPVGTVRSRLFRARTMLRDRLVGIVEAPQGGTR